MNGAVLLYGLFMSNFSHKEESIVQRTVEAVMSCIN